MFCDLLKYGMCYNRQRGLVQLTSRLTWFDIDSKCVQTSDVTASPQETLQELQQLLSTQKSQIHGLEHDLENHESGSRDRDRHHQEMHEVAAMIRQPIRSFEAVVGLKHTIRQLSVQCNELSNAITRAKTGSHPSGIVKTFLTFTADVAVRRLSSNITVSKSSFRSRASSRDSMFDSQ
jgi:hypothetical protein